MRYGATAVTMAVCLLACSVVSAAKATPWWEQGKIRYFWSPWGEWNPLGFPHTGHGSVYTLPNDEVIKRVAEVGATVFVDRNDWTSNDALTESQLEMVKTAWQPEATRQLFLSGLRSGNLNRARLAHKNGMRYFAHMHSGYMPEVVERTKARLAVNKDGMTSKEDARAGARYVPCPLDEKAASAWLFKPATDMAKTGLVDGLQIDWEMSIGGFSFEAGDDVCYCDDCWSNYLKKTGAGEEVARADRYNWLNEHGVLPAYLTHQQHRLIDVYRRGAKRVRAIKPDFIFSAYDGFMPGHIETRWFIEGAARGLTSPAAPFFVIDASHYYPNHTAPWWDTGYAALRKLGVKHILGFYTAGFMGTPTMEVSATQQLYDAALNTDGYWIWVERQWGPEDYAVFSAADKRVRATERKVGDFLRDGKLDFAFATIVEQSGNPDFGRKVLSRTFHLGERHLVQVNNVNTDTAVSVLVRFPRLTRDRSWTVSDPLTDLYYAHAGRDPVWGNQDLKRGVWLTMEKRSEAWLLLAPHTGSNSIVRSHTIVADAVKGNPDRPATGTALPTGKAAGGDFPLVFTRSGPLGYKSAHEPVMGASVFAIDAAGGSNSEDRLLFAVKGNSWSPQLSPDRTRVAFSSYINGRGQVYIVNSDATVLTGFPGRELPGKPYWVNTLPVGSQPMGSFAFKSEAVNLSNNGSCDHSPVWSSDGSRIAFVSDRDGDWEIYVMNSDGNGQKRLTRSPGIDRAPAWSPDGRWIAFESNRGGDFNVCIVGSNGVGERVLVDRSGDDLEPIWSPDGSRIAFVSNQYTYNRDIMLADPQSGAIDYPRGLLATIVGWWPYTNVQSISWSPDSKHIAATFETRDESGVFVVRAGLKGRAAGGTTVPVGDEFKYSSDRKGGDFIELVKAPPLKTRPGGVVMSPLRHLITGGWYMGGDASNRWIMRTFKDLRWSPDGKTIAFRSDMDPSGYEFFYTVPAERGEVVRLDNTLSPMGVANEPKPLNTLSVSQEPVEMWKPPKGMALLAEAPEFWLFRTDPDKVGETEKWFSESSNGSGWSAISTHDFWDKSLGTRAKPNYIGDGWYSVDMVIPPVQGRKVWLHFGAVDENYTLWVNGEYLGDNLTAGTLMWDQPVSVEITGRFKEGRPNHLVVRVKNTAFAGGIWKPVRILVEK